MRLLKYYRSTYNYRQFPPLQQRRNAARDVTEDVGNEYEIETGEGNGVIEFVRESTCE